MRIILVAATAIALAGACAPDSDKTNPAIATEGAVAEREAAAPAAGASSFTEDQARDRITAAGYTDVTGLMMGADGTWQGTAMMSGQSSPVVVDYQGNVTTGAAGAMPPMPADPSMTSPSTTPMPATPMTTPAPGTSPPMPAQPTP